MRKRNFEEWFATFRPSISGYDYYTDSAKILRNAERFECELHLMNVLIGAEDIETKFRKLITKYPECLKVIPILLAVRQREIYCQDENGGIKYRFDKPNQTLEQYIFFMRKTGLFEILSEKRIVSLYGYVVGVETGLDSHTRKDRGGYQMEHLVEAFIKKSGLPYSREITTSELSSQFGITLPDSFVPNKRWDFAVNSPSTLFAIETNFYTVHGSKIQETARSYKQISEHARNIPGFTFVWITDGKGWRHAKNNLHETFNAMENLYNITDMEAGILDRLFHGA